MEYTVSNHRHCADYTIIPNEILRCENLSFFEKGLLCFLLSLPSDFEIKVAYIIDHFGESERSILKGFKGLIEAGYCRRTARRIDGKLSGQHYQITDVAFDFSAPAKNGGTGNPDHADSRPAENPAPLKNGGADKVNNNISFSNNRDINIEMDKECEDRGIIRGEEPLFPEQNGQMEEKRRKRTSEPLCLFVNSKFYEYEKFEAEFKGPEFAGIDIYYYYHSVADWSSSGAKKKNDWIATARNFIRGDMDKGKVHRIPAGMPGGGLSEDAIKYLEL